MAAISLLSLENPVFKQFAFYSSIVVVKTMSMSFVTAFHRLSNKAFANPEDCPPKSKSEKGQKIAPVLDNPIVERARRCHLNDLENVIPFILIGLLYVASNPDPSTALIHFRVFTVARLLHTIFYIGVIPQPTRVLSFMVGLGTTLSMAYNVFKNSSF